MIHITSLDHLVLTVADINATLNFYVNILGMKCIDFIEGHIALGFGTQKINLHQKGAEICPHAHQPVCDSADLCLLTDTPLAEIAQALKAADIPLIFNDIVLRTGTLGKIQSLYIRDPHGNLIEISQYLPSSS